MTGKIPQTPAIPEQINKHFAISRISINPIDNDYQLIQFRQNIQSLRLKPAA
ncbi:hypothetical protein [Snodgrassella alvi]|jgi:hypothetical protein|uniref:hypothetical protein n=1 Tax=Snodgrassella alvi TaxID=1196083 RepID=UPI0015D537CA|nr:hypothetical protein [Snodgrassella alvi]